MRKYVVGALVGFLVALPLTTGAESLSKIGKKVNNEYIVIVDGKALPVKAISIDGTSYTPNRALADSIGYDIAFTNKTVVMSSPSLEGAIPVSPTPTPTTTVQGGDPVEPTIQEQIKVLEKRQLAATEEYNILIGTKGINNLTPEDMEKVKQLKSQMDELQGKIDALKAQATPTP